MKTCEICGLPVLTLELLNGSIVTIDARGYSGAIQLCDRAEVLHAYVDHSAVCRPKRKEMAKGSAERSQR